MNNNNTTNNTNTTATTTKTSNVISPSNSTTLRNTAYSTTTSITGGMHRSGSNRSLFLRETSTSMKLTNSISSNRHRRHARQPSNGNNTYSNNNEEDIESSRNLSIDYQEIQKRTLTKWVNAQLSTADDHIENMETDLRDGKRLLKLLSVVVHKKEEHLNTPKPERGNMRIHQLSNVAQALSFLESQFLGEVPDIGNEPIVNGDLKKTLVLISFIMLKYHIQLILDDKSVMSSTEHDNELLVSPSSSTSKTAPSSPLPSASSTHQQKSSLLSSAAQRVLRNSNNLAAAEKGTSSATEAKLALLRWVRIQLHDYVMANIIPSIQDFSRSWRNGVAFCLLIHRHDPSLIPELFDNYLRTTSEWNKQTWHQLLTTSFDIATNQMNIPHYLEPEDLTDVDYPHEPSVMMYVTEFYKVMSNAQNMQPQEESDRAKKQRAVVISDLLKFLGIHPQNDVGPLIEKQNEDQEKVEPATPEISRLIVEDYDKQMEDDLDGDEEEPTPLDTPSDEVSNTTSNPILEDLISDRDALATFITSFSPAIEAMTKDEISSLEAITQRMFAFDAIREQADGKHILLDSVNAKRQNLHHVDEVNKLDEENKDESAIHDEQQQQKIQAEATMIYNDLEHQWTDFIGLMDSTANKLRTLLNDWKEGEEDAKRFQQRAASVEKDMITLRESLDNAYPTVIKKSGDGSDVVYPLQPLEEGSNESADKYEASMADVISSTNTFDENTWKSFEQLARDLCAPAMRIVSAQYTRLQQRHDNLIKSLSNSKNDCRRYKRGVLFADITRAVSEELEIVRKTLNDSTKSVTDDAIQDLEKRVDVAFSTIQAVQEEYKDLLAIDYTTKTSTSPTKDQQPSIPIDENDGGEGKDDDDQWYYAAHLQKIQEKYETVRDWVEQVRVWFIEAQRIRKWIAERIDIIEQRDGLMEDVDPLSLQLSYSDGKIKILYDEHQALREEIEKFDADDMTRLRTHVKTLTAAGREKDLSPADTSTIEITLTTLNMLNRLKELLGSRSFLLDMLMLRMQWENQFSDAVKWVATTDEEMNVFLHTSARWSDTLSSTTVTVDSEEITVASSNNNSIEEVIQTLVYLERKIADFDQEDYSHVLDAYQEMDELNHTSAGALPDHLEKRQEGFEKAFEDLMKRCAFCRKVVEQHLKVMEVVGQFRQIKDQGEKLRQAMMETNGTSGNSNGGSQRHHHNSNNNSNTVVNLNEEEMYAENVQAFKEQSAYLITHFAAQVPYPDAPIMSTAIGTGDEQNNQLANESIKSTISAYGMSLALLADGLDQLLASRQYILSLHQRSKVAYDKMARLSAWMEERTRTLNKTKIDIFDKSNLSDMEEEEVARIEKERDGIATRLAQIEHEDLAAVLQEVQQLEDDIDTSNAVTIDRHSLVSSIEGLEESHQQLQLVLSQRAFDLDMVKRFMGWQVMWTKSNHLILTAGRKIWDLCIKKARFDPNREDIDKPSYANDSDNTQAVQLLQDRVTEIGDRHMSVLSDMHEQLVDKYTDMQLQMVRNYSNHSNLSSSNSSISDMTTLQFLTDKEAEVEQKYKDLQFLLTYTTELMTQRSIITEFLLRVQDAHKEGEKIRDAIAKMTRRIMEDQETYSVVESRAEAFRHSIDAIWRECGRSMPYPTYNGSGLLRSLQPTETSNYNAQIKAQTKALLDRKMDELQGLKESIDQLLKTYRQANHSKTLAGQYDNEVAELQAWIDAQAAQLKQQHIDITTDNTTFAATISDDLMQDLENKHGILLNTLKNFETVRLKELHDKVAQLMESTTKADIKSVDISVPVRRLGEVMNHLEQLKDALADHQVTMEAASKRILWQKKLQLGRDQLEKMSEQLRLFHANKNKWVAQDDFGREHVEQLEATWDDLIQQKNIFTMDTLPAIEQSYDAFVDYFAKLARPMATPDHIEAWMESLNRAANRFEENLGARCKELDLVRQRLSLDDHLQESLTWLQKHQLDVEQFIEDRARWTTTSMSTTTTSNTTATPSSRLNKDSDEELRCVWSELNGHYVQHCDNVISQVMSDLVELREASSTAVTNTPLVSETLNTKVQYLDQLRKRIQLDLTFAEGIVTQRNLMIEFLDRMAALEQSAEEIREEIATNTTAIGSSLPVGDSNGEEAALHMFKQIQELKAQGQAMTNDVSSKMLYPTRHDGSKGLSSDTAVSTQQQLKDDSMNALVRDTIETKGKRLAGLMESMEQLLESKENISRRKMAMEAYHKEWEACMEWIATRKSQLSNALEHTEPPCNVPGLRDGISLTDSIQSTTQYATENAMTTLKTAYEKCSQACSATDEMPLEQQAAADKAWEVLIEETARTRQALLKALVPAEIQERAQKLLLTFKELESTIADAESSTVTDEQISQWQKQVDGLESHDYEQLQKDVIDSTVASNNTKIKEQLDAVAESAVQVRTSITRLYDAVNLSRLQKTHHDNANVVQARLEDLVKLIDGAQKTYQHVIVDDDMRQRYQQLVATHREALAQQEDCKEAYNDLTSYYRFINTQIDVDDTTQERQASIDEQWNNLEDASQRLSQLVNDTAKCVENHETLGQIELDLGTIKKDIDAFDVSKNDTTTLDTAERRLQIIHCTLDELVHGIAKDENEHRLLERHAQIKENACSLDESINRRRAMHLQHSILDAVKQQGKEIQHTCAEQQKQVRKRTVPDIENPKSVDDFIESHDKTLTTARNKWNRCHEEFDGGFAEQCDRLTKEFATNDKVVENIKQPTTDAIKTLDNTIKNEQDYLELLKTYSKHNILCGNVRDLLDAMKSTLTDTAGGDETEKSILLSDMKQSIEESVQAVEEQASQVATMTSKHPDNQQYAEVSKAVDKRIKSLKGEYDQLKSMVVETLMRMEKKKKHRDVSTRLTETMRYVDKLKDRVNALQLSPSTDDKNIINVEREELREIEQEVEKIVSQKNMDGQEQVEDQDLKSQRTSLDQSISDLQDVLATRRNEETALGNISGFIRILDKLDKQAKLLQTAIDDAAPHHASVVNNKFSKTDLQSLLRNLIASYKQHEPGMTQLVKKTKAEAEKHPGDTRVSERLARALARCNKTKAAAAARERELQTCINQLDHDFFTKLAMAKTTSSTRRGGPNNNSRGPSAPSTSTASVKRTGNTLPPPLPSAGVPMTRRSSSQSSTASSTRRSKVPLRPSKTPIPSRSVSRTKYVADPKNELDMELGRIVNENVYRVKVKMVPGEVGKYWFGEINPRLVYCRILPSKLVMVRVGGGWVELSKFLRDHKLTEGSIRPNTDDAVSSTSSSGSSGASLSTSTPFQNATLAHHTTRCVSPSGRITVRGGGGSGNNGGLSATNSTDKVSTTWSTSSRRSSKTPVARGGHLDGDKYIRVDEAGNQVMVKMTKAEDGAKMPIITRRRA